MRVIDFERARFPKDAVPVLFVFDCGCEWVVTETAVEPDIPSVEHCTNVVRDMQHIWETVGPVPQDGDKEA